MNQHNLPKIDAQIISGQEAINSHYRATVNLLKECTQSTEEIQKVADALIDIDLEQKLASTLNELNVDIKLGCSITFIKGAGFIEDPVSSQGGSTWLLKYCPLKDLGIVIKPKERKLINLGIVCKIPAGWYGRIEPINELTKIGIDILPIIVDGGENELYVVIQNNSFTSYNLAPKTIVGQLVAIPIGWQVKKIVV